MDERLALLHALAQADEEAAATLEELDDLYARVEGLRGQALELQALLARLPEERKAAADAVVEADRGLADGQAAAEQAAAELGRAEAGGDQDRLAEARRFEVRARDSLHMAERRAASARERQADLDARAGAAERETAALEAKARGLAAELAARPRLAGAVIAKPGSGAAGVAEWGTRARAALLVARSQVASESDAAVRQANELGAVVLGESLPPLSAAAVARRVERELG